MPCQTKTVQGDLAFICLKHVHRAPPWLCSLLAHHPESWSLPVPWAVGCKMQAFSGAVPKQGDKCRESRGCEHGWSREGSPSAPTPRQAVHAAESWAGRWGLGLGESISLLSPFFFFSIKVWLINNTVLDSGIQHRDSIFLQIILHLKLLFSCSVVSSSLRCHEFATH